MSFVNTFLPVNCNPDTSNLETCRICLATDVKLYSLLNTDLGKCMDFISVFEKFSPVYCQPSPPKYVCYQCAPILTKCKKFIEKIRTSQMTLHEIFTRHGEITESLIKDYRKAQPNLQSPLDSYLLINYYHINYDDVPKVQDSVKTECDTKDDIKLELETQTPYYQDFEMQETNKIDPKEENKSDYNIAPQEEEDVDVDIHPVGDTNSDDNDVQEIKEHIPVIEVPSDDETQKYPVMAPEFISVNTGRTEDFNSNLDRLVSHVFDPVMKRERKAYKKQRKQQSKKDRIFDHVGRNMRPSVAQLQTHFNVFEIPLDEQIEEWRKSKYDNPRKKKSTCNLCLRVFKSTKLLRRHALCHSVEVSGDHRCPVCLECFQTQDEMQEHINNMHSKKYCCRYCPMTFIDAMEATEHKDYTCERITQNNSVTFDLGVPANPPILPLPVNQAPPTWNDWTGF